MGMTAQVSQLEYLQIHIPYTRGVNLFAFS